MANGKPQGKKCMATKKKKTAKDKMGGYPVKPRKKQKKKK